ncbi:MAG: HDOD domain-containing protein [Zoogloeaceae bacterium]|jgi:putative nucleotidyltransferase with HDIG domain|nr:HDOD domain-containing protein [Zoogloeaceae bacterium]
MSILITPEKIQQEVVNLPAFPPAVYGLLSDLEDENAGMMVMAQHVERDPILAGRVLSTANRLLRNEGWPEVRDVYTAVSLIGFAQIREIVLTTCISGSNKNLASQHLQWSHSLAAGIAAKELASRVKCNHDEALVAGLLHDVGQFWLAYVRPLEFQQVRLQVEVHNVEISEAERAMFGVDHCEVGRIIAEHWQLPKEITDAIAHHHAPADKIAGNPIVASVHLAEMIVQALDLPHRDLNYVSRLSSIACRALEIDWDKDNLSLLGAIDARYQYALSVFP